MIKNINTTITEADIRKLIDRYMSGETTNEEEAKLRSWFRLAGDNIPEEWRPLRALFSFVDEAKASIQSIANRIAQAPHMDFVGCCGSGSSHSLACAISKEWYGSYSAKLCCDRRSGLH